VFSVRETDRPLRQEDLEALTIIAAQVSQAIERRRTTEALQQSEERFRQSMEFSGIGHFEIDLQRRTILMSENWRQRIGLNDRDGTYSWDDYLSHIHPDDEPRRQESMTAYLAGSAAMYEPEYRVRMADGSWSWVLARLRAVRDESGAPLRLLGIIADISDLKQREEAEKFRAEHDELTGVYNRRGLESIFAEQGNGEGCSALMLIDIREFALINAAHGRVAGDEYLIGFAEFLREVFSQNAIVGRSGGAEFILLFVAGDGLEQAQSAFETIESVCIQTQTGTFCVQLRCGIADGKQGLCSIDELIRQADMALRQAKEESGSCCRVFDGSMLKAIDRSYAIREQLNHAMSRQEFYLEYQPVFDIRQQPPAVVGYEALLRWEGEALGRVSPGEFIPVVENSNLILPLGQWVLEEACRFSAREQQRTGQFAPVAVNLSVRQLIQPDFVGLVQATLTRTGVPAAALQLEVTESLLMTDFEKNAACLAALRDHGIGISLDDFGTGYSSFTYLARLPITMLKIDKSMIDGIDGKEQSRNVQLVESLLHMSQKMGYEVVVEGVERSAQLQMLQQMGFSYCQGYLLGRPARK
jgi:diguanylate cyclase (GGDEF)-like protein/PAS domain S-box-containing protein